jgi:hypothetical protein
MADTQTTNYNFTKIEVGASEDTWGGKLNTNWDNLDTLLGGEFSANAVSALTGTAPMCDLDVAGVFTLTTSGNTTFTFSNPSASGTASSFVLILTAGGAHTITWPASVDWDLGLTPLAPASGETNAYVFLTTDGGTRWFGFLVGEAMA